MGVLVVLACERENPGFKLKGTGDEPGETTSLLTTSASGPTVTSDTGMTVPTTTGEPDTSSTDITQSSSGTTTAVDPTTSDDTTDATTGDGVSFPVDCNDPVESDYSEALIDTFFVNEAPAGQGCTLNGNLQYFCRDMSFSEAPNYDIFLQEINDDPMKDLISLYAVRFAVPQPTYHDLGPGLEAYEGTPVKPQSWVGGQVKLHLFRPQDPAAWTPMTLQALRLNVGDVWEEGKGPAFAKCVTPAPSFRCRQCVEDATCKLSWSKNNAAMMPLPYTSLVDTVAEAPLESDPGAMGTDIDLDLADDAVRGPNDTAGWLFKEGMLFVPAPGVLPNTIRVSTREALATHRPQLRIKYCNPIRAP